MPAKHYTEEEIDKYLKSQPNRGMAEVCTNCGKPYGIHCGFFCDVQIENGKVIYSDTRFYPESLIRDENDPNWVFRKCKYHLNTNKD